MALRLGELSTVLTADRRPLEQGLAASRAQVRRTGQQMEQDARETGRRIGEGIARGADGRLRDERGRFVAAGRDGGEAAGGAASEGVLGGLSGLKAGALVVGAAVGAALGTAITSALDLSRAQAKLDAQIGNTEYAKELGSIAGKLYGKGFGESIGEAMEAVRSVTASGLLDEDATNAEIESVTRRVQSLASTFDLDLVQASRAAGQMVRNGLARDAGEALDLITRGFQQTGDQAGDLLDSMSEYSTQFRKLGLSGAEAMGLMTQGVKAGARDLDTVADALKEFAIRAADGSKASAEGFEAIGLNARKMTAIFAEGGPEARDALGMVLERIKALKDPTEREAAAVALFGTKAEDLQGALMGLDPSTAVQALGDVGGAAEQMADTLEQSAGQRVEAFKRQAMQRLTELGGGIIGLAQKVASDPGVKEFMGDAKKFIQEQVVPALRNLWGWIQDKVIPVLRDIQQKYVATLRNKLNELKGTVDDNREELARFGNAIKTVAEWIVSNVLPVISDLYTNYLSRLIDGVKLVINWIGFWVDAFGKVKDAITSVADWVKGKIDWIADKANGLKKKLSFGGLFDGIKGAFKSALNWVIGKWNSLSFGIPTVSFFGQTIGGGRVGVPQIPYLAKGGIIPATPGGRLVVAGEAGQDEAVIPLPRGAQSLTGGGGHTELRITGELRVRGSDLVLVLRDQVALRGGQVQQVIGTNR